MNSKENSFRSTGYSVCEKNAVDAANIFSPSMSWSADPIIGVGSFSYKKKEPPQTDITPDAVVLFHSKSPVSES
jgi:hypothetical protein